MAAAARTLLGALLCIGMPALACAQVWPQRSVRVVVPFSAGGAADVVTRIVVGRMSENLGKTFVVENRTGANGSIGTEMVARAAPDGYTILAGSPGTLAINPHMYAKLPYDAEADFIPASHVATFPQILVIDPKIPATTLKEFIAYARARPKALTMGSSGTGSTGHLIASMFMHEAGITAVHVPFRGGGPAAQALASGSVDFVVDGLPTFQALGGGDLVRFVAITAKDRWPKLPEIAAISEEIPNFDLSSWVVFAVPKGTDPAIADAIADGVNKALANDEVKRRLAEVGAWPMGGSAADALRFQRAELAKWKTVVEVSGAKADAP
jgi:tripartite-type tricarboxylate transporter receptor subunit TctC